MNAAEENPPDATTSTDWCPRPEDVATIGTVLSPGFLEAVARLEALPQNRDGSDKSWVWRAREDFRLHFARAKQV